MTRQSRLNADIVKSALVDRCEDMAVQAWGEPTSRMKGTLRWGTKGARVMQLNGRNRGLWNDHEAGQGGDVLDFYAKEFMNLNEARDEFPKVLESAAKYCGVSGEPSPQALASIRQRQEQRDTESLAAKALDQEDRHAALMKLADASSPANVAIDQQQETTHPATRYLNSRGLSSHLPGVEIVSQDAIPRYTKKLIDSERPSVLFWMTDSNGERVAVNRVYLNDEGQKVGKQTIGDPNGAAVRFPARDQSALSGALAIAEGPESAATIWDATGVEVWAVCGTSNWEPVLKSVEASRNVILFPDADAPGSQAHEKFETARSEAVKRGLQVSVIEATGAPETGDINDILQKEGREAVAEILGLTSEPSLPEPATPKAETISRKDFHALTTGEVETLVTQAIEDAQQLSSHISDPAQIVDTDIRAGQVKAALASTVPSFDTSDTVERSGGLGDVIAASNNIPDNVHDLLEVVDNYVRTAYQNRGMDGDLALARIKGGKDATVETLEQWNDAEIIERMQAGGLSRTDATKDIASLHLSAANRYTQIALDHSPDISDGPD